MFATLSCILALSGPTLVDWRTSQDGNKGYVGPEGSIKLIGVCRIGDAGAICWSPSGTLDPKLSKRINGEAYFSEDTGRSAHVKYRYGLFEIATASSGTNRIMLSSPTVIQIPKFTVQPNKQTTTLLGVPLETWESKANTTYRAVINRMTNWTKPAPLSKTLFSPTVGLDIEFGAVVKSKDSYNSKPQWRWQVTGSMPEQYTHLIALDSDGVIIRHVDDSGFPIAYVSNPFDAQLRNTDAKHRASSLTLGPRELTSNIDPIAIKSICVQAQWSQIILFTNIPLDPK
jgi:hypothetical protein